MTVKDLKLWLEHIPDSVVICAKNANCQFSIDKLNTDGKILYLECLGYEQEIVSAFMESMTTIEKLNK